MTNNDKIKFIDLFCGIGGFHLGLERASNRFECAWANDFDKYSASVYQERFPSTVFNGGDITKIRADWLPDFDLLVAGFPCQSFSIAGKRRGFADTRGTMFFEIARILEAKRPRLVLLENVKGLLNHDGGRTFETIISTLDELRYNCEWQCLNSKDFGVPQNRERVFIVGHFRGKSRFPIFPLIQNAELYHNKEASQGSCLKSPLRGQGDKAMIEMPNIAGTLSVGGHGNGLHSDMTLIPDEQAVLKQVGVIGKDSEATRVYDSEGLAKTIKNGGGMGAKTGLYAFSSSQRKNGIECRLKEGEANTLTQSPTSVKSMNLVVHNLQPRSPDRPSLQKNPSAGGSGHLQKQDGSTYCLDSGNSQAIELQGTIRRLTPRECERLQGFPDDWILIPFYGLNKDMADGQRYKMCGNAVTTNVVTAIGKKLLEAMENDRNYYSATRNC